MSDHSPQVWLLVFAYFPEKKVMQLVLCPVFLELRPVCLEKCIDNHFGTACGVGNWSPGPADARQPFRHRAVFPVLTTTLVLIAIISF